MLWTDVITPAELTGYARAEQDLIEQQSLARYLPNRFVADIVAEFVAGAAGLIDEARYRAYDAEPEVGGGDEGESVLVKLPAISQTIPVSEYNQLRLRNASDEALRAAIERTMRRVVRAIADRSERTRGIVLSSGKATVTQKNYRFDDDFGRDASLTSTAAALWSTPGADRLGHLKAMHDQYVTINGVNAGRMLMSQAAFNALAGGDQFAINLVGGGSRPSGNAEVQQIVTGAGLPEIEIYNRRTKTGPVLPADSVLFVPAPVDPSDWESSELGATFWGQTLTSMDPLYELDPGEEPGIVVGAYRGQKVPMIAEVTGDSISLPVAANANLTASLKVL